MPPRPTIRRSAAPGSRRWSSASPATSITAIVIGVLYMKGMNPGPTVFLQNPQLIYAVFIIFILANLLMLPLGWLAIKWAKQILRVPRNVLLPIILIFCIVGSLRDDQPRLRRRRSCWRWACSAGSWRRTASRSRR